MNVTVTPPPAPPAPTPAPSPRRGGPGKPVAIVLIVIGGLVLLGAVLGAIRTAVHASTRVSDTLTTDASGITSIDVEAAASRFRIEFGAVDQATLDVIDARSEWTLTRDGDELDVTTRDGLLDGWGLWGWGIGSDDEQVVLTLPEALRDRGLDADLSLSAGELQADGSFGALDLELGAGGMDVTGSAESLSVDVSAGTARFDLADVTEADVTVSAGRLVGELTGSAPDAVGIVVSAGSLELTLPAEPYDVRSDVSAGELDNRLETSSSSPHRITADVSAGRAVLDSAD
ncbi:hypothetical protein [Microbacterium rhizophilus]|uniref:hypothetical protein n=1 Tax=Microbacterium rhizophilus TaxID=3138934 RepID=UPI0031EDD0C4